MANLIDGKNIAKKVSAEVLQGSEALVGKFGEEARPNMTLIVVGNDPVSRKLVAMKANDCEAAGITPTVISLSESTPEEKLLRMIDRLNRDEDVKAILCQLPLPEHISTKKVLAAIAPEKDVDGFHPVNVGRMAIGLPCFISATPLGIMTLLKRYNIPTSGKKCVVLGRSNIVGKPMAQLMMQKRLKKT